LSATSGEWPSLAVVVPTHNRWERARVALDSLFQSDYPSFEVVLVEDGCTDGTVEECRKLFPHVRILHGDGDLWWSGAANLGSRHAVDENKDAVVWLNDDNRVEPGTLRHLADSYRRHGPRSVACARVRVTSGDESEWIGDPPPWDPQRPAWKRPEMPAEGDLPIEHPPGGQGVLIPTGCFREVGYLDRARFPMSWADHDFHYRAMKAGYAYRIAVKAVVWNEPNVRPPQADDVFTLRGAWWFLQDRRSYGNLKALRRHLVRHLPPREYRRIFYPILWRHILWLASGWAARRPLLHRTLRGLKRHVHKPSA
jgi:GT2 family glycosyltransferase